MLPELNLEFVAIALRGEATAAAARPATNLDERHPQDARDIEAFRRAGWSFYGDVNWSNLGSNRFTGIPKEVGLLARRGNRPGRVIIRNSLVIAFASREDAERLKVEYGPMRELPFGENIYELDLRLPERSLPEFIDDTISAFEKEGASVRWVEPVVLYHVEDPAAAYDRHVLKVTPKTATRKTSNRQWHWKKIARRAAWIAAGNKKGVGTCVAVIDKGFHEHKRFKQKVVERAHLDEKGNDVFPQTGRLPVRAHGTMCAGLVAADVGGGRPSGAAPACQLMLVALGDVIDSTGMAAALKLCADRKADIITCAVGPSDDSWDCLKTLLAAIDDVQRRGRGGLGTLIVWAVANVDRKIEPSTLESYPPLICVAPSDESDVRHTESEYGHGLDLLAPGVKVRVLWWDYQYGPNVIEQNGASVAAPCVAGVAALVLSYKKTLKLSDLIDVIAEKSCDPPVPMKRWDPTFGWGRLNAKRAIEEAKKLP